MYAIVDIETTGGHASANGITEIAICIHNGKKVVERYTTLVNPGRDIPIYISALTGITNDMVQNAPPFEDVAHDIYHLLNNKIFVAHNVNFDYSFVRHHLAATGYDLRCNKLCTVRLGRKIMPGLPSYSLGKLCRHLNIDNESRHRAAGDAEATAQLFSLLLQKDTNNHITAALKQNSKEQVLPANLPKQDVDALPQCPGVYYFHNEKGKVIYVGKAKNLKKRVCSHFTGNNPGPQRQEFLRNIHHITFEACGTELVAFVLEAVEIKRLWPKYNRSLKRFEHAFSLYAFEDQRGYIRLAVDKHRKMTGAIYSCNTLFEGRGILMQLIDTFRLCPKLCFIQNNSASCTGANTGNCACEGHESVQDYNERVGQAISQLNKALPTFAIRDAGRTDDEHSCLLIEKGKFYGMGYISHYYNGDSLEQLKEQLKPYPGNDYIRNMVDNYAVKFPDRKMIFAG
ncbi:exonuclease domain-containing protein [Mucilaginibacter sp. L3T2-6]|uniref:exonuclease domain-containing protein n=1 Tax=Mucilaginibacter sp. L3T2-6 TaxID=3062491 RepID=UPI0026774E14|nr:exonuclease domain-containing protein [Mucilaginibacter sp. L3T2-6]MDO3642760.1 exonuclease domain-containing protein [Mucilaginibacter sp. L3T2-6]MDV6215409.1 exonuclease domain-containing protein [Mucilaginibacter sp. L3T2-6]